MVLGDIPCRNPNLKFPGIHPLLYSFWSFCAKIGTFPRPKKLFSALIVGITAVKHKAMLNINISIRIYRALKKKKPYLYACTFYQNSFRISFLTAVCSFKNEGGELSGIQASF